MPDGITGRQQKEQTNATKDLNKTMKETTKAFTHPSKTGEEKELKIRLTPIEETQSPLGTPRVENQSEGEPLAGSPQESTEQKPGLIETLKSSATMEKFARAGMFTKGTSMLDSIITPHISSGLGGDAGTYSSSMFEGAGMGATIAAFIAPAFTMAAPLVVLLGGVIGGAVGFFTGWSKNFEKDDDAFRSFVEEKTEEQLSQRNSDIRSGSVIASQREQDAIDYDRLLGKGKGKNYQDGILDIVKRTPMEYGDLNAMSQSLVTGFRDVPERMLTLMEIIGNAGAAEGMDISGMSTIAAAMSEMRSGGKVTAESLNLIQSRGVDAAGMLFEDLDYESEEEFFKALEDGAIDGAAAVDILQEKMDELYSGAMEPQSKTFAGVSSALSDAETEMQNAYGEGYNEVRSKGIKDETAYLTGESGAAMQEANKAIGAWQASLENDKEKAIRDAQNDVLENKDYIRLMAEGAAGGEGSDAAYAEAGRMLMEAKVQGEIEYNKSEGAQLALASELSLADHIRADADSNEAFWNAGKMKADQYSLGLRAGLARSTEEILQSLKGFEGYDKETLKNVSDNAIIYGGYGYPGIGSTSSTNATQPVGTYGTYTWGKAFGQNRVPYDNFPALLHEGERVLTASQARAQDSGSGGVSVQITGPVTVREEADIGKVARALAAELTRAKLLSVPA